jgi:two-component system, OmpR family, sensor histidine kinase CpxA
MRRRFPLYAKILLWFFLNLLLLGLAAVVVVGSRVGLDALLVGYSSDRIRGVIGVITAELRQRPSSEWDAVLQRHSDAYGVKFLLFGIDGTHLAGEAISLPAEAREVFSKIRQAHRLIFGRDIPDSSPDRLGEGSPAEDDLKSLPVSLQHRRFIVRTSNPTRYWITVPAVLGLQKDDQLGLGVLMIMSDSLDGGGLFFDMMPLIKAGSVVVLFSVLFWLPVVRGITRSIGQMTRATEQIAAGRFDVRVPAKRRDELGQLGEAVNSMTERLEGFVTGQKRFLGDIAHELCSPLARAQMAVSLLERRTDEPAQMYVRDVREEIEHMSGLVGELLSFSKASLGKTAVKLQPVNVRDVVERAVVRETRPDSEIRLEVESGLRAEADPDLLQRAMGNLLRNAVSYAGNSGPITVSGCRDDDSVLISVSDCGSGVPEESLQHLFDPFYRVDNSRARETGGIGLGLTIVKTCIEACGGSIICRNRKSSGLEVLVRLQLGYSATTM